MTMAPVTVNSTRLNRTVHTARFDRDWMIDLANAAVAEQLGLDLAALSAAGLLTLKSRTSTYQDGSLGTAKPCIEVEIIVHHPEGENEAPRPA